MITAKISEDNIFTVISVSGWVLLAVLTLAGMAFGQPRFAFGILAGGLLVMANFYWLKRIMGRVLNLSPVKAGRYAQFRYILRLAILALVVYVLVARLGADVLGLLLGLSVLVIVITVLSLYMFITKGD